VGTKRCTKCGVEKPDTVDHFYNDRGRLAAHCKLCHNKDRRERYRVNREREREKQKEYYEANKEKLAVMYREYAVRNKEKIQRYQRQYKVLNREKLRRQTREYMAKKRSEKIEEKIKDRLRARVNKCVKFGYKGAKTMDLIGCSVEYLMAYLESKFKPGMSWENYGSYWHIDHIRPCASFDLTDKEQQKICFHYTNLQPLEAIKNIKKGAKWKAV